jgi:hypothetical protein
MTRTIFGKVMWVGRTTVFLVGLTVMLAVFFGFGTAALAAVPGDPFKLGRINAVDALTQLIGTRNNALLRIENNSKGPDATALDLQVDPKKPPMKTNSLTKVDNLHADLLDGRSANQFANGIGGTAVDADNLDGKDSTAFASGTGGKADDANRLDGEDSTAYFSSANTYFDTADAVTGKGGGTTLVFTGVPCDPGDRILNAGGGASVEDDMIEERPTGTNSWLVRIRDNGAPTTSTVVANCLDFPPLR